MRPDVVIVGAGFGGLATAVELARCGLRVTVVERETTLGGKARRAIVGGRSIDVGPTVLTMRWVFDELFAACDRRLDDVVQLLPLDTIARHVFGDGSVLDLFADVARTADAIGDFAGPREASAYRRFAAYGATIAATVEEPFLRAPKPSLTSVLLGTTKLGLGSLRRIDARRTMWTAIRSFFSDPRLIALFARYATYVGSSPLETPATLNLIAHVEREGVSAVVGGMSALAEALADVARSLGVDILTGGSIRDVIVTDGRAAGVVVDGAAGTSVIDARAVVLATDVASIASGAFGRIASQAVSIPARGKRSLSALTWAIAGRAEGFDLAHHNVFFSDDYLAEHRALFGRRQLPSDPTIYLCAPDRSEGAQAAANERLFVVANAPATADEGDLTQEEIARYRRAIEARFARAGLRLEVQEERVATPATFEAMAPGTGGAIYGQASHGALSAFERPGASTRVPGIFLAGGSVHPGPGVPMATLSGISAARAVLADLNRRP